ncbi:MAG TPA: M20/M25/M40 family metallo-hydrolase [Solirubrobacteraceae bacterium]|nr:M20/M25/M40 family metallo-hydrolase [Solirubrobacteraceae bacterium]
MPTNTEAALHERPAELLQRLIRFDTTNPPGNERACIEWIGGVLREAGVESRIVAQDPQRPNLIARLAGAGAAPALLMQGHVDVVPAQGRWSHPPFGGEIGEGYVWGRGALDMKGGVAMMVAAFLRAAAADVPPPGDVVLCVMSDEEAGGGLGARFLVKEHPELFDGVRFGIGEFGGFTLDLSGRRFYPVMVAEKQLCVVRATLRGAAGHGSLPVRNGAMGRLGRLLTELDRRRLPVHVTAVVGSMVEAIAAELPAVSAVALRGLLRPRMTDLLLDHLGERVGAFDPLLHNTASATIVRGGQSANVIPGEVSVDLDCRLLPGFGPDELFAELHALARVNAQFDVLRHDPGPSSADMTLFPTLAGILRELDRAGRAVPLLLPAVTDGRHFARLGIQTYGFLPMQLPPEMPFMQLIHAEDERIPTEAIEFGATAIRRLLERFAQTS